MTVLTNAVWLHHGSDLTGAANQINLEHSVETQDDTVFGYAARSNVGGLHVLGFSGSGLVDPSGEDGNNWSRIGDSTIEGVLQMSEVPDDGSIGYAFKALASRITWGGAVGDLNRFDADGMGRTGSPLVRGTILYPKATNVTNTRDGVARQLGAAAATAKIYGALNVVSVTGGTPTCDVIIESDTASNFPSPTTRLTFTQATGQTSGWQATNGPVTDTWWRAGLTIGGSSPQFNLQVLVGIQ